MLNRVILMGRITQDLEVRQTPSGNAVLRFNVAVDRPVRQGAERQTDFITCTAWGQRAEFINRYFSKGRMIALEGQIRTGSYDDKNGVKHYTTEVNVDSVSFTGEPKQQGAGCGNCNNAWGLPFPITTEMVVISRIITSRTMVDIHSLQTILIRITITMLHQMTLCPLVTLMILKKY